MKKALSLILTALMLVSAFSMLVISASAADAPSGQIWEGESDLRRDYTIAIADWSMFYLQNNEGYNDETAFPNSQRPSMDMSGFWKNNEAADELEIKLDVKTSGKKTFIMQCLKSSDFGIFDIYFDNTLIGDNMDFYCEKGARGFFEFNLGQYDVTLGTHTLKIKCVGKNELSTNYVFLIDYFEMVGDDGVRRTQKVQERDTTYGIASELEDGTIRYEGEGLTLTSNTLALISNTAYYPQAYGKFSVVLSYNWHFFWKSVIPGDEIEFEFNAPEAGEYEVTLSSVSGPDYGMVQWSINGAAFGEETNYYIDEHTCKTVTGKVMLKEGVNILGMLATGADERATNFVLSLDYVDIKKVGEYVEPSTPDVTEPTPVETEPTPVETEPTPVETEPTPTETEPTPTETEPTPTETEPTPVDTQPQAQGGCGSVAALSVLACLIPAALIIKKKKN